MQLQLASSSCKLQLHYSTAYKYMTKPENMGIDGVKSR